MTGLERSFAALRMEKRPGGRFSGMFTSAECEYAPHKELNL